MDALRSTQAAVAQTKRLFDQAEYPDEALVRSCDVAIAQELAEFYAKLSRTHAVLTELVLGYVPDDTPNFDGVGLGMDKNGIPL